MRNKNSQLIYFFSETHYFARDYSVLGVTFVGPFDKANIKTFMECYEQIQKSSSKCVVLNFRDVPALMDGELIGLIDDLLKGVRARPAFVRLSGLHPDLKSVLTSKEIVQADELANNLADALSSLPVVGNVKKVA